MQIDFRRSVLALGAAIFLAACGGSSDGGPPAEEPPPEEPPPEEPVSLDVELAFANLSFTNPVLALQAPNDDTRWFVVEQNGRVLVFDNSADVASFSTFVDIT